MSGQVFENEQGYGQRERLLCHGTVRYQVGVVTKQSSHRGRIFPS